jgi:RNA polymerase sigma-70 factor (ECF subfamily)
MDEPELAALYHATADRLRTYLYRVCGERRIVEDLLQEAYYRLLRSKFSSPDPEEMARYLFGIASNLLRDHWAEAKRARSWREALPWRRSTVEPATLRLDVHSALGTLKPAERELLWLAYAEGYSHAEIAGITGVRPASVRVLLFRARARLVRVLDPGKSEGEDDDRE